MKPLGKNELTARELLFEPACPRVTLANANSKNPRERPLPDSLSDRVVSIIMSHDAQSNEARMRLPNPLRPRAFGGKGAEGMKKEIPSNRTPSDPGPSAGRELNPLHPLADGEAVAAGFKKQIPISSKSKSLSVKSKSLSVISKRA
jgi:hypothetical protein